MDSRQEYRNKIIIIIASFIILISTFAFLLNCQNKIMMKTTNEKIESILILVQERYPDITKSELVSILNSPVEKKSILKEFGIDIESESVIYENDFVNKKYFLLEIMCFTLGLLISLYTLYAFNNKTKKEIKDITKLIEEINHKNYKLDIDGNYEDELSILKNEIYKTTIMLKEDTENSRKDKLELKSSLSDISHQLKTPLTSILIMLDNLLDDPDMDVETKEEFIRDIKREINNINFFIQNILKLSKFDLSTVTFINEKTNLNSLVEEALKKVYPLIDLKNITIEKNEIPDGKLECDKKWQVEAISNIIKNCLEHSESGQKIVITLEENKVYLSLEIKDFGSGISPKDLPHIFEKVYKGENSTRDSIGIGLSLAKTIIESAGGRITVESNQSGTTFTIKYFKN